MLTFETAAVAVELFFFGAPTSAFLAFFPVVIE